MNATTPEPSPSAVSHRLLSLDALRGFDMFWIVGGDTFLKVLFTLIGKYTFPALRLPWPQEQFEHVDWDGFHFEDLIFPLFVFLSGVALPFSLGKRVERGETNPMLYWRIARRTALLILLGLIYNDGGLLTFKFAHMRYPSVLARIGLAYGFAAIIMLHAGIRGRVAWLVILLVGYWAAMTLIPVPGFGAGRLAPGMNLADYIDLNVLPGRTHRGDGDPEGLLSTLPAIGTALMGLLAGQWLRDGRYRPLEKTLGLFAAGGVSLALGALWDPWFPINKNLWSSSFVLWAGGWSLLLLGLFYLIIDVWGWRRWTFPLVVIGVNPITIYLASRFIDFQWIVNRVFHGAPVHRSLLHQSGILLAWLLVYLMYRNKIFWRV